MEFAHYSIKEYIDRLPKGERKAIMQMLNAIANVFPILISRCEYLDDKNEVFVIAIEFKQLIYHKQKGTRRILYIKKDRLVSNWKEHAISCVVNHAKYLTGL